jgi:mannose-6-phosphate isomerase-like protein (cupin superfamily)
MKIEQAQSVRHDWDKVKSWNYKLKHLSPYQSVVYAEITDDHGEVNTNDVERIYYIVDGKGEFVIGQEITGVAKDDVFTVPPHTIYNYHSLPGNVLKVVLIMELWDN